MKNLDVTHPLLFKVASVLLSGKNSSRANLANYTYMQNQVQGGHDW